MIKLRFRPEILTVINGGQMKHVINTIVFIKNAAFILLAGYLALLIVVAVMKLIVNLFQ